MHKMNNTTLQKEVYPENAFESWTFKSQCISPYQNMKEENPFVSIDIGENCLNLTSTHDLKKQTILKKIFPSDKGYLPKKKN